MSKTAPMPSLAQKSGMRQNVSSISGSERQPQQHAASLDMPESPARIARNQSSNDLSKKSGASRAPHMKKNASCRRGVSGSFLGAFPSPQL